MRKGQGGHDCARARSSLRYPWQRGGAAQAGAGPAGAGVATVPAGAPGCPVTAAEPGEDQSADANGPGEVLGKKADHGQRAGNHHAEHHAAKERTELGDERDTENGQDADGD